MKRVHILGRKNSGKTTLIVELVEHFVGRGVRVGTIKHTHHRHELDTPGKDSHRHRSAGAAVVGIVSPGMDAVFVPKTASGASPANYARFEAIFSDCALVLVEGDLQADAPKVEVWRAAAESEPIAAADPKIVAVISDDPVPLSATIWPRTDIAAIAERLLQLAGSSRP